MVLGRCKPLKTPGGQRKALVNVSQEDSSYFLNKKDPISISLFLDHYFYHIGAQNARADNKHLKGFKEETLGTNYNHQMWEKSFH